MWEHYNREEHMATLYEYWIETSTGRRYFKEIQEANRAAKDYANESGMYCVRYDLHGGQSVFRPDSKSVGHTL